MAAVSTIIAATAAVVGAASYVEAKGARKEQAAAMAQQAEVQREVQSEQKAINVASATAERRQQIREARVRRARIMQSAQNTGAAGSSAEFGAIGGLGTQLTSNIGTNVGQITAAGRMSDLGQTAADFGTQANLAGLKVQDATSMFNLSTSIFTSMGGVEATKKAIS
jgi:hypothetical protein